RGGLLGIGWQQWLSNAIPVPPTDKSGGGRAHNYSPSGRPEKKSECNARHHGRFLADRPRAAKARARRSIGRGGRPAGPRGGQSGNGVGRIGAAGRTPPAGVLEVKVEFPRAHRDQGDALPAKDAEPVESTEDVWTPAAQIATVGIFVLLLGACLFFAR